MEEIKDFTSGEGDNLVKCTIMDVGIGVTLDLENHTSSRPDVVDASMLDFSGKKRGVYVEKVEGSDVVKAETNNRSLQ